MRENALLHEKRFILIEVFSVFAPQETLYEYNNALKTAMTHTISIMYIYFIHVYYTCKLMSNHIICK